MVKRFYQALEEQDKSTLRNILHPHLFGIRNYKEESFYDIESYLDKLDDKNYHNIKITRITSSEHYIVEGKVNSLDFVSKIVLKDGLIYKVYESLKTGARRIKCVISYDGTNYSGYQRQKDRPSIQATFEDALQRALHKDIKIHSSGRTDKGVHAMNQVIHFDLTMAIPLYNLKSLLNSYLDDSIYIKEMTEENETFHARYDVLEKTYMYKMNIKEYSPIYRNYEWTVLNLDVTLYKKALHKVLGEHDFTSFTKTTKHNTIRTIYDIKVEEKNHHLYTYITGNGFLRYMVRNIIGAAVLIASKEAKYTMEELLYKRNVTLLQDKAPACGLYLYNVNYALSTT